MSKTHSLDIKTIYQTSLIFTILLSVAVIGVNIWQFVGTFSKLPNQPSLRIREQQLQQAVSLTSQKSPEN